MINAYQRLVSIPKRVLEALKHLGMSAMPTPRIVSIPKRVLEALKHPPTVPNGIQIKVSIPKRVLEALKLTLKADWAAKTMFQSLKGF